MIKRVIAFDLDDTLYKEIDFLKSAFSYIAYIYHIPYAYTEMIEWYKTKQNVFENLLVSYHINTTLKELINLYHQHRPTISLDTNTEKILRFLKLDAYTELALITDGYSITQRHKIEALDLYKYFEISNIFISEEIGYAKPSQKSFLYLMKKYADAEYWYIGDNTNKDFITPNRLGWKTIAIHNNGKNIHPYHFYLSNSFFPHLWIEELKNLYKSLTYPDLFLIPIS